MSTSEEFASLTSQMTGEPLIETGTKCSNWLISELFGVLAKEKTIEDMSIRPADLAALLNLIHDHTISGRIAKEVLEIMVDTGDDPAAIIEAGFGADHRHQLSGPLPSLSSPTIRARWSSSEPATKRS